VTNADQLERTPPAGGVDRSLWAMGFTPAERDRLRAASLGQWFDPVQLGNFVASQRHQVVQNIRRAYPGVWFAARVWRWVQSLFQWRERR